MTRTRLPIDAAVLTRVQTLLNGRDSLTRPDAAARPQIKVTAQADGGTEILLYDEISWWGVSAVDFAAVLSGVTGPVHLRVSSPGGDVFDALAIYNMLLDYPGTVTVTVDGLAASAASFIAMAGSTITMNRGSKMMIHDASGLCIGNAAEMNAMAALLDMVSGTIADIYAARSGVDADTWRSRMRDETWYGAADAVEAGLADAMVPMPDREGEGDGEPTSSTYAELRDRLVAALFPYGMGTTVPRVEAAAPPTEDADELTPTPAQASDPPPLAGAPRPAPAPPAPEPAPDWGELVAHLIPPAPPSADTLLAHLREA